MHLLANRRPPLGLAPLAQDPLGPDHRPEPLPSASVVDAGQYVVPPEPVVLAVAVGGWDRAEGAGAELRDAFRHTGYNGFKESFWGWSKTMNIYKVERRDSVSYDEYAGFVVVAASESEARTTNPEVDPKYSDRDRLRFWPVDPADLVVTELGQANPGVTPGLVMASFKAG
jgi:hypothetical protein